MKQFLKKISIAQLILEFISVVFAVLLALGLNSYKQSIDLEDDALLLKRSILMECQANLEKLDSMLNQNIEYTEYLDSLVRLPKEQKVGTFRFSYEMELLAKGAWEVAQNNPAVTSLDSDFLLDLSNLYNTQDFFMDFFGSMVKEMGSTLSQLNKLDESDLILSMHYKVSVINTFSEELKSQYIKILDEQKE